MIDKELEAERELTRAGSRDGAVLCERRARSVPHTVDRAARCRLTRPPGAAEATRSLPPHGAKQHYHSARREGYRLDHCVPSC